MTDSTNPSPSFAQQVEELEADWENNPRWHGTRRDHSAAEVVRLRGSVRPECTLARAGAAKLWQRLHSMDYVHALGAMTGGQAIQFAKAGLPALYLSGWQVAGDANLAGQVYPDQSLYPADSVPSVVARLNNALRRADQIEWSETEGNPSRDYMLPIVADAEAGFGGPLNAFELMKAMIESGAAGVHFEDQLSSAKKCGHMGGKVLVPTSQHLATLRAARLAADVIGAETLLIARTDALSAGLITSDIDVRDRAGLTGERTAEGFFVTAPGLRAPIQRGLAYAPYCDLLWCETSTPDLDEAREFAEAIHAVYPNKMLAYNCSPLVQLAGAPRRRRDSGLPEGAGLPGLRLPVHHARRMARAQRLSVRVGLRLPVRRHEGVRGPPAGRDGDGAPRLHRHPPPARGRRRILRPGGLGHLRGHRVHPRTRRQHRTGPILESGPPSTPDRTRTRNLRGRNPPLYPVELRGRVNPTARA